MANGICDICKRRPASFRAQVSVNGERQVMELCDDDYRKLARQQRRAIGVWTGYRVLTAVGLERKPPC